MIHTFDIGILNFFNDYFHNPIMDKIMPIITFLGNNGYIWIALSIPLLISKKYRHIGILTLSAIIVSTILGEGIIKNVVQRPRPFLAAPDIPILITKPLTYSFPSGHTACGFAAAFVLSKYFKKYNILFFTLACLIAFSRMYLFVHYPTDIIGGILLGTISAFIVLSVYKKKFELKR